MTPAAPLPPFARRLTRVVVLWLLAIAMPLQGAAVGVFAAQGPAHLHRAVAAAPQVLEDLRRWRPAAAAPAHAFAALGHFHAGAAPERHRHRGDDTSVDAVADPGDGDEAAGASAVAVLAMLPVPASVTQPDDPGMRASRPGWTPRARVGPLPERPPKRA